MFNDPHSLAVAWFARPGQCAAAIVVSVAWPYRFAFVADTRLVTPDAINAEAGAVIDALAAICERQRDRLRGTDYSTGAQPWDLVDLSASLNMAMLRFDPRSVDAGLIRAEAVGILAALKRGLESTQEIGHA